MRRTTLIAAAIAITALGITSCSSTTKTTTPTAAPQATTAPSQAPAPTKPGAATVTADQVLNAIAKTIPTAKLSIAITAENDPNSLLGRPGQYTSKVDFTDSRVPADKVDGLKDGDVERGGAIEVFATAADAKARADYIQGIVKGLPMLLEYDFPHGPVLVRVSHFLTPAQAAEYDKAIA